MPGTENTVRIKTDFMGANIFNNIINEKKDKIKQKDLIRNHSQTYGNLLTAQSKASSQVYAIQKNPIDKSSGKEDKELTAFKYNFATNTIFGTYGIGGGITGIYFLLASFQSPLPHLNGTSQSLSVYTYPLSPEFPE